MGHARWSPRLARTGARLHDAFRASAFGACSPAPCLGDVILAEDRPAAGLGAATRAAARTKGATLVTWCQDLFPEVAAAIGFQVRGWDRRQRAARPATPRSGGGDERRGLRADGRDGFAPRASRPGGSRSSTSGPDGTKVVADRPRRQPAAAAIRPPGDRFVIGYSGNLGRVHEVETLVELMAGLSDEPELVS